MSAVHGSFISSNGMTPISYTVWTPEKESPKGIVQIVHGMCEHVGRYDDFMSFLAANGFAVYAHDQLGHGATAATEEDLGYFAPLDGYKFLLEDVRKMKNIACTEQGPIPYFLMGHSMGSFVARLCANTLASQLDGAIFSGTGGSNPLTKTGIRMAERIIRMKGGKYRSSLIDQMAFGLFNSKLKPRRTGKDWLTRDEEMVDRFLNDRLCTFVFTASAFRDLFSLYDLANSEKWFQTMQKDLPIYLFSGSMDPVGNYGKGVREVYDRLKKAGVQEIQLKLYHQGRHEMLNEINRKEVYADVLSWLNGRLAELSRKAKNREEEKGNDNGEVVFPW